MGLSAKAEEAGGIDLIIIYNSGRFRTAGRGSSAGLTNNAPQSSFPRRSEVMAIQQFAFQSGEGAFGHRIVETVPDRTIVGRIPSSLQRLPNAIDELCSACLFERFEPLGASREGSRSQAGAFSQPGVLHRV